MHTPPVTSSYRSNRLLAILLLATFIVGAFAWQFFTVQITRADNTGPRLATSSSDCISSDEVGVTGWLNPGNAAADDDLAATTNNAGNNSSHYLKCTNFGFTTSMIPAGSNIDGIVVGIERLSDSTSQGGFHDAAVRLIKAGVVGTTDRATSTVYTQSYVLEDHGSATDLWGESWDASDIIDTDFGVAFAAIKASTAGSGNVIRVDRIEVTVYFTPRSLTQSGYRWFANSDTTSAGSPLAAMNTATTLASPGQAFRLRPLVHVATNTLNQNEGELKLQYAERGADEFCDTSFAGETYQDLQPGASTGNTAPTSAANDFSFGTRSWTSPTNALASDDMYASASPSSANPSNYLKVTDFDLNIPPEVTIQGIEIEIERYASHNLAMDAAVRIVKGGVIGTTDRSSGVGIPTTERIVTYGGPQDLWGETWTIADITSADFGVAYAAQYPNTFPADVYIDSILITIYYQQPPGVIAVYDNPTPADGASIGSNPEDPSHGGDTVVGQSYIESSAPFSNDQATIPSSADGLWDISLQDNGAPANTTYCFRMVHASGLLLDTYSVIPEITTASNQPEPTPTPAQPQDSTTKIQGGTIFRGGTRINGNL